MCLNHLIYQTFLSELCLIVHSIASNERFGLGLYEIILIEKGKNSKKQFLKKHVDKVINSFFLCH